MVVVLVGVISSSSLSTQSDASGSPSLIKVNHRERREATDRVLKKRKENTYLTGLDILQEYCGG